MASVALMACCASQDLAYRYGLWRLCIISSADKQVRDCMRAGKWPMSGQPCSTAVWRVGALTRARSSLPEAL